MKLNRALWGVRAPQGSPGSAIQIRPDTQIQISVGSQTPLGIKPPYRPALGQQGLDTRRAQISEGLNKLSLTKGVPSAELLT